MEFQRTITEFTKGNSELKFGVKVVRWFSSDKYNPDKPFKTELNEVVGPYTWNVYVILYEGNKLYDKCKNAIKNSKYECDSTDEVFPFEWHGGCTYAKVNKYGNIQIGDDYQHYGDDSEPYSYKIPANVMEEADALWDFTEKLCKEN